VRWRGGNAVRPGGGAGGSIGVVAGSPLGIIRPRHNREGGKGGNQTGRQGRARREEFILPERRNGDQTLTPQIHPGDAQNHQTANKEHQQDDQGN